MAAFTTTTVRRAAAATAATRASCAPGQGERGLVAGLGLLLLGEADDDHGDVGVPCRGDGGLDRLVVGQRCRPRHQPHHRVRVGELELGPDQGRPIDVQVEQVRRGREDRLARDAGHRQGRRPCGRSRPR